MRFLYLLPWLLLLPIEATAARYALIVGQNDGGAEVQPLRYAESDARHCRQLLLTYGSLLPENTTLLVHPDSSAFDSALDAISLQIKTSGSASGSDLFFLYFSGHADATGLLLDSTHFSFQTLRQRVETFSAAMKIAIFDACQSGSLMAYKGGKRAAPIPFDDMQKIKGEVWIASSAANEKAQESESLKGSLFSYHLFNGLRGSADISGDKKISLNEAYHYAYKKTIETSTLTSGIVQHPMYRFNISGEGDIILSDLTQKTGGITIGSRCRGSFLIMSRDYAEVFADFRKEQQKELFIALAPGDYTVINAQAGSSIGMFECSVSGKTPILCAPDMFQLSLIEQVRSKGGVSHKNDVWDTRRRTIRAGVLVAMAAAAAVVGAIMVSPEQK